MHGLVQRRARQEQPPGIHGSNHPQNFRYMGDIARARLEQGKLIEAEKMQIEVLEGSKSVLGEEHLDTLRAADNLASTLQHQGRWEEVGDPWSKVVANSSRVLGDRHCVTFRAMASLAYAKGCWSE